MIILLTNDDGYEAPGLKAMEEALDDSHDIWILAPEREMSGQSHSITLTEGIKISRFPGEQRFSVHGTPVDCVNLASRALLPRPPDLVISGINKGPNLGTDILYSGTCGAAREAALMGIPALAVSFASLTGPWEYGPAASFIADNLQILTGLCDSDSFVNINWPEGPQRNRNVVFSRPGRRRYLDEMVSFSSPRGGEYWFLQPAGIESSDEPGTDTRSIKDGRISISVIAAEPVSATEQLIHDMISWRGI